MNNNNKFPPIIINLKVENNNSDDTPLSTDNSQTNPHNPQLFFIAGLIVLFFCFFLAGLINPDVAKIFKFVTELL